MERMEIHISIQWKSRDVKKTIGERENLYSLQFRRESKSNETENSNVLISKAKDRKEPERNGTERVRERKS